MLTTKPRHPSKTFTSSPSRRRGRRFSPLMLIGAIVTVLVALIGAGVFVVLPRVQSHAAAAANPNCTLIIPNNPLSAQGLATPYQLVGTNAAVTGGATATPTVAATGAAAAGTTPAAGATPTATPGEHHHH